MAEYPLSRYLTWRDRLRGVPPLPDGSWRFDLPDGGYARWTRTGYACVGGRWDSRGERRVQPITEGAAITALASWLAEREAPIRGRGVGRE